MGTTYQAQVEVFVPAIEGMTRDHWQEISRWELQKDYAFSRAWSDVAEVGWPDDVLLIGSYGEGVISPGVARYDLDQKRWGDGALFVLLEPDECFAWFVEVREHVKRLLERGCRVRVLTWAE